MFPSTFSVSQRFGANTNYSLLDSMFLMCIVTSSSGGGLFIDNANANADVQKCSFVSCESSANGGGLYISSNLLNVIDCCFLNCKAKTGSSSYSICQDSVILRASMSFGIATHTGSANSDGTKHSFDQGNISYHTSNYQIAIFFSMARTRFNCYFNHFVHSQDVQGCSLTIHYAKDAVIESVNIFNITTGTTHALLFFGYNSKVSVFNSLLFKGTHPKGFSEYENKGSQVYQFINCSINFPLFDFGSWPKTGSSLNLSATFVPSVGNTHYDCYMFINRATFINQRFKSNMIFIVIFTSIVF